MLLTTQDDNSRIRWSASQECLHVLSADIRPYFKKLLGTLPALLQEVALPVNFMSRNVSTLAPFFEAGVRLLQRGRVGVRLLLMVIVDLDDPTFV